MNLVNGRRILIKRIRNTRRNRQNLFLKSSKNRLILKFHRGNRTLYGMVLDREGKCLICGNDKILKQVKEGQTNPNRCERAFLLGKDLGKKAKELGTIGFILDRK